LGFWGSTDSNLPRLGIQFQSDCQLPTVTTDAVSISGNQITFTGTLSSTGSGAGCPTPPVELAFEQGTQPNVGTTGTFSNAVPASTTTPGSFSLTLSGLTPNQTYYFRAVAINEAGRSDGELLSFTFTPEPVVQDMAVTSITDTSAQLSANLVSPGTSTVTSRGFCVRETAAAAGTEDCARLVLAGPHGTGTFTTALTGLEPVVSYTVRAFATNSSGTSFSSAVAFTTPAPAPTITSIVPGDAQAVVSFTHPGTIDGLQYELDGSGTWITAAASTSPLTITGLTNDTQVSVRIRSVVATAPGLPSAAVDVTPTGATGIVTTAGSARLAGTSVVVDPLLRLTGSETLSGATVVVESQATGDALACTTPLPTGISCVFNTTTRVLTLSGSASVEAYQTALRGVTFSTTSLVNTDREVRFSLAGTAFFLEATGHYYEWVTAPGISWTNARDQAEDRANYGTAGRPRGMAGLQGYLVTVTSQAENDALRSRLVGQGWMGATDALDDKQWRWVTGPEGLEDGGKGRWFFTQAGYNAGGSNTCGTGAAAASLQPKDAGGALYYSNWASGEPNDFPGGCRGGEDYAHFLAGGTWNDYPLQLGSISGYVVEYGGMPGDPALPAPLTATRTVALLPAQSISLGLAASTTFTYGDTVTFSPSATSGLPVTVTVTGAGCTLEDLGAGTLSLTWVSAGSCTVTANQSGIDLPAEDGGWRAAAPTVSTITTAQRPLTITGLTATSRVYDGTTAVAITGAPTIQAGGVLPGDADGVALAGAPSGALTSTAVGVNRPVTVTGLSLTGDKAGRYRTVATVSVDITRRPIAVTGSFTVADRVYNGSSTATVIATGLGLEARSGDRGRIATDSLSLTGLAAQADSPLPGTRTATLTAATLSGGTASNYLLSFDAVPTATFTISGRLLTVSGGSFTVIDKVYDGSDAATITPSGLTLTGFVGGDTMADVTWTPAGRFTDTSAGSARTVELVGGAVLGGAKGAGYALDLTGAPTATATITPRPVTVVGATASARPYDGSTTATISGAALANTVAGDVVSLTNATAGIAAARDAGTHQVATTMTLTGADATNYVLLSQPSVSITITPLPVSVSMNALPARAYDGTTALPLPPGAFSVSGLLPGEQLSVSGTAQLSSRAAGTRTVTLQAPTYSPVGGANLANYTLPASVSGTITITPVPLRVVGASVAARPWDGTTTAIVTGARLEGARAGDAVSLSGATAGVFASALPGTHAVRFTPTLAGADAGNYTLVITPLSGTISRAPATLRITGGLTQFADGAARTVRAAVSPASAGRVVISYSGGPAPTTPGTYAVTVTLDSDTHQAESLSASVTVQAPEALLSLTATSPASGSPSISDDERRELLLARIAVRTDGTLALPEIGPVLEPDGSSPSLRPNDTRVVEDGQPIDSSLTVLEQERVRIAATDGSFAIELHAAAGDRSGLLVDSDGTLLLDRTGYVDVGGSGFLSGSTVEVWMFSTPTFIGTAIVGNDGTFGASFLIDDLLAVGEHTIQLSGIGPDERVRSTSIGVRIEDPESPSRERIVLSSVPGGLGGGMAGPTGQLLLALTAVLVAVSTRYLLAARRRRREATDGPVA
jgi:hypothetical protein